MGPVFNPNVFVSGAAVGVLGLVLLFSLIISYAPACNAPTLRALGGYLMATALVVLVGRQRGAALLPWPHAHRSLDILLFSNGPVCRPPSATRDSTF